MTEKTTNRRDFLRIATTGGAAAGAAAIAGGAAHANEPQDEKDYVSKGYRETEHVKKYYETTRF